MNTLINTILKSPAGLSQWTPIFASQLHTSAALCRVVSGKYRITKKRDRPLTYEMANPPHYIAHRKTWNSWNTYASVNLIDHIYEAWEESRDALGVFCDLSKAFDCVQHETLIRKLRHYGIDASLKDGLRRSETAIEDEFIRRFMTGTWHGLVCSEVIIKRQFNHIRVAAIIRRAVSPTKMYFLLGYTEELLSTWLQCPITLELQTVDSFQDVVFKYI